ncbi:hypothetical protein FQA39_LY16315 [Lamprigera yunnana]|nr:hypothetical protein FQA39_LY16315 [Lamprigera yunnana]
MLTFLMLLFFWVDPILGEKSYEMGKDSYIDAYIQAHQLNKSKIKRKLNVEKDHHDELYPVYSGPKNIYGPPDHGYDYGSSKPIYGPPPYSYGNGFDSNFGIPYALVSIFDKLKSKLEIFTLLKILLKLVLFKKFVSFVGIICLLLFIPWIKDKHYAKPDGGEDDGDGDVMRKIRNSPLDDDHLNNLTVYIVEAIRRYAQVDERASKNNCDTIYCKVNEIAKTFADKYN